VGFCVARFDKLGNARAFDVRRAEKMYEPLTLFYVQFLMFRGRRKWL